MPILFIVSIVVQAILIIHCIKTGRNTIWIWVIALLSYQPAIVLFAGFVAYALSGYVASAWKWMALRRRRSAAPPI